MAACNPISITLGKDDTHLDYHIHGNSLFSLFPPFPLMDGPVVRDELQFVRIFGFLHCIQGLCQGVISWLLYLVIPIKLYNRTPISSSLFHKKLKKEVKKIKPQSLSQPVFLGNKKVTSQESKESTSSILKHIANLQDC